MGTSRKSKKRKHTENAVGSDEEAGIFTVELILKARVAEGALDKSEGQQWDYYVKWAGYDSDANTWEPAINLAQCERLVESFWDDVGRDNEDYPEGSVCVPSSKWIATERKRFWQNLQPGEREKYSRKEEERRAQTQQRKALEAAGVIPEFSSPEPPPQQPKRNKTKKKHKKPRVAARDSEADSGVPLATQDKSRSKLVPAKRKVSEMPTSSDDEPLGKVNRRKTKVPKISTSAMPSEEKVQQREPQPESKASPASPAPKIDKGKERAVEEPRPDSPSSLFSVDSSEEVVVPSPKKPPPVPERKLSATFASSSKAGSAKSSPVLLPKVPRRLINLHNKLPGSTASNVPTSGLSTKQRLSQLALAPVNPKEAKKAISAKSSTPLESLHFKRNPSTIWVPDGSTAESPTMKSPELTLNALNASPAERSPSHIFPDLLPTASPVSTEPPDGSFITPQPSFDHVDEFLSSVTPLMPGFTAPLESVAELSNEPKPPPGLIARKTSNIPKIPKKWKWEGKLFTLKSNGEEELVGLVVCTNVTTPKPRGMRIHLTFDAMDRLNFLSFHDLSDVPIFLEACKSPDQFATLSALDADSSAKFQVIAGYMARHEKVALVPVWYEKNLVGHLLILCPTFHKILKQLEVPAEITKATDSLIVSLHGWVLSPAAYEKESRLDLSDLVPAETSLASVFENSKRSREGSHGPAFDYAPSLRTNFKLHFALRVLKFPPDLYEWLTTTFRIFAIYHECERGDDKPEPIEHAMLKTILKGCQAQEWKHHDSRKELRLRVVFVHAGSIRNFHRSPLTQKRISLDIRFYSYGTDGTVPREMWGIREIYPIGGVVTFYPSAFIDNYPGTIQLIRKIHEHPLWMAFISPTCLGYLANYACKGQDSLVLYERQGQVFIYQTLLTLIADGEVSLITAPPEPTATIESTKSWIRSNCRTMSPLDALSIGTTAFNSVCANKHQSDWMGTVQQNVNRDIVTIQRHPAILYEYRRFVVVKGERDQSSTPSSTETATPHRFIFQDDYFKRKG